MSVIHDRRGVPIRCWVGPVMTGGDANSWDLLDCRVSCPFEEMQLELHPVGGFKLEGGCSDARRHREHVGAFSGSYEARHSSESIGLGSGSCRNVLLVTVVIGCRSSCARDAIPRKLIGGSHG